MIIVGLFFEGTAVLFASVLLAALRHVRSQRRQGTTRSPASALGTEASNRIIPICREPSPVVR